MCVCFQNSIAFESVLNLIDMDVKYIKLSIYVLMSMIQMKKLDNIMCLICFLSIHLQMSVHIPTNIGNSSYPLILELKLNMQSLLGINR